MYVDSKYFTPIKTGMIVKECGRYQQVVCYDHGQRVRLWVIRNASKYESMDNKALYQEYKRQMVEVRNNVIDNMWVVK